MIELYIATLCRAFVSTILNYERCRNHEILAWIPAHMVRCWLGRRPHMGWRLTERSDYAHILHIFHIYVGHRCDVCHRYLDSILLKPRR